MMLALSESPLGEGRKSEGKHRAPQANFKGLVLRTKQQQKNKNSYNRCW